MANAHQLTVAPVPSSKTFIVAFTAVPSPHTPHIHLVITVRPQFNIGGHHDFTTNTTTPAKHFRLQRDHCCSPTAKFETLSSCKYHHTALETSRATCAITSARLKLRPGRKKRFGHTLYYHELAQLYRVHSGQYASLGSKFPFLVDQMSR
jgi:hypothetical protein